MDISPVVTAQAKWQAANRGLSSHRFVTCDVRELPFATNSLDVIVSNSTLDHFPDVKNIVNGLSELYRVLKPGGALIITLDNRHSISYLVSRLKEILRLNPFYIGKTCSMRELTEMLEEVGFFVSEATAIIHGLEDHTSTLMRFIRKFNSPRLNKVFSNLFVHLERLETAKTKYLTGSYIAAKALKPRRL